MLPLSLERTSSRRNFQVALAWIRPANVATANTVERRALVVWLAIFFALFFGVALGHVWLRLQVRSLGYQLSTTRQVFARLEQEKHELTVQVARLDAPGRLEEVARTRLGMVRPEKGQEALLP